MIRRTLKKIVIGTLMMLAAATPLISRQRYAKQEKPQRIIMFSKNDSFIQTPYRLGRSEEGYLRRMDELAKRLAQEGYEWREIIEAYCNKNFRFERGIARRYRKRFKPRKALSYARYRKIYGLEDKIRKAYEFYEKYKEELDVVERTHGFDKRHIVATLGIESDYGRFLGKYYAFNALTALFASDTKKEFGYKQMKYYIEFCKLRDEDLFKYKSSYAGAIGPAQFLPENLLLYFGREKDPLNMIDCFHAVAEYHLDCGWDLRYNHLIPREGTRNWKVIKRYNNSKNYVRARNEIAASLPVEAVLGSSDARTVSSKDEERD